jgi:putative membrane protein
MMGGNFPMHMGWVFGVLFILVILAAFIFVFCRQRESNPSETPLNILKKRYAKGEISEAEFEHMKKELEA